MIDTRSFKQRLARVFRQWQHEQYDAALADVEGLLGAYPGNSLLYILWASLVQLQEKPSYGLEEVKEALQRAIDLEKDSAGAEIELGHFLDAVEDDPQAASRAFSRGILAARRLLIDGLLGHARAQLQLGKKEEALKSVIESLHLANEESSLEARKSTDAIPDILLRDHRGGLLTAQLKGPFAMRIQDLLDELFPKRSA